MNERRIHQIFAASPLLKGAHALVGYIGHRALVFISTITSLVNSRTQEELIEDPKDFVATHILSLARNFTLSTQHFYAFYLLCHDAILPSSNRPDSPDDALAGDQTLGQLAALSIGWRPAGFHGD